MIGIGAKVLGATVAYIDPTYFPNLKQFVTETSGAVYHSIPNSGRQVIESAARICKQTRASSSSR